jgi:tetratricopeptide (TPR) repeat protein
MSMFSGDALLPFSRHSDVLVGPAPADEQELVRLVEELKRRGNAAFQQKALEEAEALYSRAIEVNAGRDPLRNQHIFLANRSAARCAMGKAAPALEDAEACVALDAAYAKGYFRQAQALSALKRFKEAQDVLERARELEPSNKSVVALLAKVQEQAKQQKEAPAAPPKPTPSVTRVEVSKDAVKEVAKPSRSKPAQEDGEEEDEAAVLGNVRGYKKLADGRVTTFFNNELSEEAKRLIGDIAPKKVVDPNKVQIKSVEGGSAWNQGNTFEEKDMTAWAKGRLEALLTGVSSPTSPSDNSGDVVTGGELSGLTGDASIAVVRGAKRYIFDFSFSLKCSLQSPLSGEAPVEGELRFLDVSSDAGADEYDVEAAVPTRYASARGKALHAALASAGSPFRRAVAARLAAFVAEYQAF